MIYALELKNAIAPLDEAAVSTFESHGYDTMGDIWHFLHWNFKALASGVYPDRDWLGRPFEAGSVRASLAGKTFMGGLFAILIQIAGDYDWEANELKLAHWGCNSPCSFCRCNKTTMPYTDFRPTSLWMPTIITLEEFHANRLPHQIFNWPDV